MTTHLPELTETPASRAPAPLSLVLFSGTEDKLSAAAILAAGAAMMGRPVRVFLQYWAADAFLSDRIADDHGTAAEASERQAALFAANRARSQHWSDTLRQAKELGDVRVSVCALALDLLGATKDDFDPVVDDVEGVVAFMAEAGDAITFI